MATMDIVKIFCSLLVLLAVASAVTPDFNDKLVAKEIEIDATWVDADANHKLDIVIVLDESGSVGEDNYKLAKHWIRSFLDFFSVSTQFTQVGLVTFSTSAHTRIPINRGVDKCAFLTYLDKIPYDAGATNMGAGLKEAYQQLIQGSRVNVDRKLIVLISDGWSTQGPDPFAEQRTIRAKYPKSYFMVVAIGAANDYFTQLTTLATKDSRGKSMVFALKSFKSFAHVAYYFHKGTQGSQLFAVDAKHCSSPRCNGGAQSFCACDSLGRGEYECGCPSGNYAATNKAKNMDECQKCPLGEYISRKSTRRTCRKCGDPTKETTSQTGSISNTDCICKSGFVNAVNGKTKETPCATVRCAGPDRQRMDNNRVDMVGSCQNTFGSKCSYRCLYGYAPANKDTMAVSCDENGHWTHATPRCLPILCPILTKISNAKPWKCTASPGLKLYQHGTQCQTECMPGYKVKPSTTAFTMCTAGRVWSGKSLQCQEMTCMALPEIPNGGYLQPQCAMKGSTRSFGMVCEVQCNSGFKLRSGVTTKYKCTPQGNWDNVIAQPECMDIQPPVVDGCSAIQHQYLDNEEGTNFARYKLFLPTARDNSKQAPAVSIFIETPDDNVDNVDPSQPFHFPIGNSIIKYSFTDAAGNEGHCSFDLTVRDIEAPKVISCEGPVTNDSYIYTKDTFADVKWAEPVFEDNSGKKVHLYGVSAPGQFRLGTYTITYIARDDSGNNAKCSFKFTVIGQPCPPLHVPYNGALACDKMSFGTVCVPQCQQGLSFFLPDDFYPSKEYFCTLKGKWRPSHAYIPDCSIREPYKEELTLTFEGECNDEETQRQIQINTFTQLQGSVIGQNLIESTGLTSDAIHVQCGQKNDSIIRNDVSRRRRSAAEDVDKSPNALFRQKRDLTAVQLEKLRQLLGGKVGISVSPCSAGQEMKTSRGKRTCYTCPPGFFKDTVTQKCAKCPIGEYSLKNGTVGRCTPCDIGTTTSAVGAGNRSLCVEQCPVGHFSRNGLMSPVNCKACPKGSYADKIGLKQCITCPSSTTTSDPGAKDVTYCQAQCPQGYFSHNGLAPCTKCLLNTYQPRNGQRLCLKCPFAKTTLAQGSTNINQCIVIDECQSNPCRNGGSCADGTNRFICNCRPGWAGATCENNVDECALKPCWSGATCIDLLNDFKCTCPPGFQGKLCNLNINECLGNPCTNGGKCVDLNGDFECSCLAGYGGKTCQINQDDCTPGICQNGGRCVDKLNGFTCQCASGFRGEQCTENEDNCGANNCLNGATCVDLVNKFSCRCAPGFDGSRCETNVNDCARNPCINSGVCTDAIHDYHCTCKDFWGGKDCSIKLSDCFNLDMTPNTIEDYVMYNPAAPLPAMSAITVKYSMKSNDKGLQAHYGTIISYGLPDKEGLFNIRAFPEQMLQVNQEDWLTGVDATDNTWHTVCMTWTASTGMWRAYSSNGNAPLSRISNDNDVANKKMSKSKPIPGGGRFVLGQLYQGHDDEFNEGNIYQGELSGLSIWYKWDQCLVASTPDITWPNIVYNGKITAQTNKKMIKKGFRGNSPC